MIKVFLVILLYGSNGETQVGALPFNSMRDCEVKMAEVAPLAAKGSVDYSLMCMSVNRVSGKKV